jgi:alkyl sulfatase BDS1-like metallo-beta-lactamase superfamily hydrolase
VSQPKPATTHTAEAHRHALGSLPFSDRSDFERATRNRLAALEPPIVTGELGRPLIDLTAYSFLDGECPPEVHPSLWRQAQLNCIHGLFEVVDGIYQVRGYDLSNITFVRGTRGWIVIDPLTVAETAAAARALVDQHFGPRPITAVIYTHSHVDHFGGVRGIISDDDVQSGDVVVIAPDGFLEAAVSENVIAGTAMRRRAMYMYGVLLPPGHTGHVDCGLGKRTPIGTTGLIAPTDSITHTGETRTIDGVTIEFQITPGTEAPAEMNFWFPQFKALCMAENCSATMHNLYTPRGAEVRDALGWSTYIDEAIERYVDCSEVAFASHHWPRWGAADIEQWLGAQRDMYRFLHDETMRLANHGLTAADIAERIALPPALADEWSNREYYGTVNHNVKAIYQKYLGWFDGNPANLHPHPPVEQAQRIVRYMGGADAALSLARSDFAAGDYRWVAQVCNWIVFADPDHTEARLLGADALEQMGYQTESSVWRGFFLMGAQELRNGTPALKGLRAAASGDTLKALTATMALDLCAVKLDGTSSAAAREVFRFDIDLGDGIRRITVQHGVLRHSRRSNAPADASIATTPAVWALVANQLTSLDDAIGNDSLHLDGDRHAVERFLARLEQFELFFPIIEPVR